MGGYGNQQWGSNNNSGNNRGKIYIIVTILIIIGIGWYYLAPVLKERNARSQTYSLEDNDNIITSDDTPGNPFYKGALQLGGVTVGYYSTSAETDPIKGKFYFTAQSLDVNKNPRKQDFILDLAISNDGGNTKTFLCTNRYVDENELNDEAEISLSFSLDKLSIKTGTIIYYSIKKDVMDSYPTVGEITF